LYKIEFGTDGWRDLIDENFTFDNVKTVAQAVADYVNDLKDKNELRGKELVVGYDSRRNSEEYAQTAARVLAGNGIRILMADRITSTPAVSFAIKKKNLTGGVMITASHNPPEYNGFKYKAYYGGSADTDIIGRIEARLHKSKIKELSLEEAKDKGLLKMDNIIPDQIDFISKYVDMKRIKMSDFKVLVDSMYGAGGRYLEGLLSGSRCKVKTIHAERDVNFGGIHPEPIEQNLQEFIRLTKEDKFDIGLATDGDVDRIGCAAPDGKLLNGQHIMGLLLWHFVENRKMKGEVVTTVCGTVLLEKICEKYGLKLHETPVGFKYICDIMRRANVLIGGEEAGGIGFKNYMPERDGILSGLLLLEMMAYVKKPLLDILNDLEKEFGTYRYLKTKLKISKKDKNKIMSRLAKEGLKDILGSRVIKVNSLDGIKFICDNSNWLLFRPSGTEPILRIYSEAETEEKARKILDFGKEIVSRIK